MSVSKKIQKIASNIWGRSKKPSLRSEQQREFAGLLLRCGDALKKASRLNEDSYLKVPPLNHDNPRNFFLYAVSDEIQKAAISAFKWSELLSTEPLDTKKIETDAVTRNICEHLLEEQNSRIRRLSELLVDLICFSTTNKQEYFRYYLLLYELDHHVSIASDLREYWAANCYNFHHSIQLFHDEIRNVEKDINLKEVWFLRSARAIPDVHELRPGTIFASASKRIKLALLNASKGERIILGLSYSLGYGRESRDIHFTPIPTNWWRVEWSALERNVDRSILLGMNIIKRAWSLMEIAPEGEIERLLNNLEQATEWETEYHRITNPEFQAGDLVLVDGYPAEVIAVEKSRYGYQSFKVKYLAKSHIPGIESDTFPGRYIQLVFKSVNPDTDIAELFNKGHIPQDIYDLLIRMPPDEWKDEMRKVVVDRWKHK